MAEQHHSTQPSHLTPKKEAPDRLTTQDIVDRAREVELEGKRQVIKQRGVALLFILVIYTLLLAATIVIIFFQGFHFHDFKLDPAFLNWLGGATIAEVAIIAGLVYRDLFRTEREAGHNGTDQQNS